MNLFINCFLLISLFLFFENHLFAQAPFKAYLNLDTRANPSVTCSTTGYYDTNTAVTFFGDSRADFVNSPIYGFSSLDTYFATGGSWNLQNFGVAGMDSQGFKNQIQACFRRDPDNSAKPLYPNFKIARGIQQ